MHHITRQLNLLLLLLVLLHVCSCASAAASTLYNGTFFTMIGKGYAFGVSRANKASWDNAKAACKAIHPAADLAILRDPLNYDLVASNVSLLLNGQDGFWFGLYQRQAPGLVTYRTCGNWTWIDEDPTLGRTALEDDVVRWANNGPNGGPDVRRCASFFIISSSSNATVDASDCTTNYYFVCGIPLWNMTNSINRNSCPRGMENRTGECSLCPPGKFSDGTQNCKNCAVGAYSSVSGASSCSKCALHFFSDTQGSTTCNECPSPTKTLSSGSIGLDSCILQTCSGSSMPNVTSTNATSSSSVYFYLSFAQTRADSFFKAVVDCASLWHGGQLPIPDSDSLHSTLLSLNTVSGFWLGAYVYRTNNANLFQWQNRADPFGNYTWATSTTINPAEGSINALFIDTNPPATLSSNPAYSGQTMRVCQVKDTYCSPTSGCGAGRYLDVSQLPYVCKDCPAGQYQEHTNVAFCKSCPAGKYSTSGQTDCAVCPAGKFQNQTGSSGCILCAPGFYQDENNSIACKYCKAGSYQHAQDSTFCISCEPGRFQSLDKASFCRDCSPGSFQPSLSSTTCILCQVGKYNANASSSHQCIECPAGRFQTSTGASGCKQCGLGSYSRFGGSSVCFYCPVSSYSSTQESSSCISCPDLAITESLGSKSIDDCSFCIKGYYGNPKNKSTPCKLCPVNTPGLSCPEKSLIPLVDHGYYRDGESDVSRVYVCNPPRACMETGFEIATKCETGFTGFLCGKCAEDFFRSGSECKSCPSRPVRALMISLFCLLLAVLMYRVSLTKSQIPPDVRILLQAIQTMALFPSISVKWPPFVREVLRWYSISNLNIELLSPECAVKFEFWDKFYFTMFLPVIFAGVLAAVASFRILCAKIRKIDLSSDLRKSTSKRMFSIFCFIIVAMYTLVVAFALQPFNCYGEPGSRYVMANSPSEFCYDAKWFKNVGIGSVFLVGYGLGFPFLLGYILFKNRSKIDKSDFQFKLGVLCSPYKKQFYYWELANMFKKLFLTSSIYLIPLDMYFVRYFSIISILFAYLWIEVSCCPYASPEYNFANHSWSLISLLVLLCQGLIFQNDSEIGNVAYNGFGILIIVLIVGTTCLTSFRVILRLLKGGKSIQITQRAFKLMESGTVEEISYLHSEQIVNDSGSIEVPKYALEKEVSPEVFKEIMSICSLIGTASNQEFEMKASEVRDASSAVSAFRKYQSLGEKMDLEKTLVMHSRKNSGGNNSSQPAGEVNFSLTTGTYNLSQTMLLKGQSALSSSSIAAALQYLPNYEENIELQGTMVFPSRSNSAISGQQGEVTPLNMTSTISPILILKSSVIPPSPSTSNSESKQ